MWKKHQQEKRVNKKIKLAVLVLAILVVILLLGKTIDLITSLNKPVTKNLSNQNYANWDGQSSINVVFLPDKSFNGYVYLLEFSPKEKKAVVLKISSQVYLELPKDFGAWTVGSIYRLGQEEKPQIGATLLKLSLSKLISLPVDGIIFYRQKEISRPEDLIGNLRKNPLSIVAALQNSETDLALSELIRFYYDLSKVRADQVVSLDLAQTDITESKLLADSSRVLGVDTVKLDLFIREKMADPSFLEESDSIAIFNATDYPGLATLASKMVINMGGTVVQISNTEQTRADSTVVVKKSEGKDTKDMSLTASRLTGIFAPKCLKVSCQIDDSEVASSRAKINIVLGEDYYNLWYTR